jgi:RNA polymerase sigma-70 factor (ECF subfamily)
MPMSEEERRGAEDHILFAAYILGDQDAFKELYRRYNRRVRSWARKCAGIWLEGGETQEKARLDHLCQEIWLTVAKTAEAYKPSRSFRCWVFGIARNVALHAGRDRARHPEHAAEAYPRDPRDRTREPNPARLGALRVDLTRAMESLDQLQRDAIELKFFEGMNEVAIARKLGVSPSTIGKRLREAMWKLRPLMSGWGRIVRKP